MAGADGSGTPEVTGVEAASSSEVPHDNRCMLLEVCVASINSALQHPTVRFLRERMEKAGCPVPPRMIRAKNCASNDHIGSYGSRLGEFVRRRALLSVRNNPYCSERAAKEAIESV